MCRGRIAALGIAMAIGAAACAATDGTGPDASALGTPDANLDGGERPERPDADGNCEPPGSLTFDFTGQIETFVVPDCVVSITIEAFGAQGGAGLLPAATGGLGARVKGTFAVTPGDPISILVGQQGAAATSGPSGQGGGAGGGGSFAVAAGVVLAVAGGGGGATSNVAAGIAVPGGDAVITDSGQAGSGSAAGGGGVAGGGGSAASNPNGFHVGTGGGGFSGDGLGLSDGDQGMYGTRNASALSFASGGAGGAGGSQGRNGGFGGGGAAGFTGAGGGGFSGGGAGNIFEITYGGGGGGSLNAGASPEAEPGVRAGSGQVVLSW